MNFFPENSNNNMAEFMEFFPLQANKIWDMTDSKKAVAVYFSLQYYYATTDNRLYKKGYAYLSQMSGCSEGWLTPTLKLLHKHKLIKLQTIYQGKNCKSYIYIKKNNNINDNEIREKLKALCASKYSTKQCTYYGSNYGTKLRVSELDSEYKEQESLEKREGTLGRLSLSDTPPVAVAAADNDESSLPIALWGGQDPVVINKFFNALKSELIKKYNIKEVEKQINSSLNSIKSRTKINNLNSYLVSVKKNIIAALDRSLKTKPKTGSVLNDNKEKEILPAEVMELTEEEKKAKALEEREARRERNARFKALMGFDRPGYREDEGAEL